MDWTWLLQTYGLAAKTAVGFFWKAGWAFVLGYTISSLIQAFVPRARLAPRLGQFSVQSIGEATFFGAASSSCSFAALATARSLVKKGAHFIAAVAFMFASTNLVIELGILILIFLGWQFLAAEIVGGILLIGISSTRMKLTYPEKWLHQARRKVEQEGGHEAEDFDWKERIQKWTGWCRVGQKFVMEWKMVWREILIGFTIAGFVAVFVPASFWKTIFLNDLAQSNPGSFLIALENAAVAPFIVAFTFIGSMVNIPLAAVLNEGCVLFGGIMGFIYSDLMVSPLVKINAKYYGWPVGLYIAVVMFVSILITALALHFGFYYLGITPEAGAALGETARFGLDYTFYLNLGALLLVGLNLYLAHLHRQHYRTGRGGHHRWMWAGEQDLWSLQSFVAYLMIGILLGGLLTYFLIL